MADPGRELESASVHESQIKGRPSYDVEPDERVLPLVGCGPRSRANPLKAEVSDGREMHETGPQQYDAIGAGYALRRRPDARLAAASWGRLGEPDELLNVGAGAGSYEPRDRVVVAVEPALSMVRQRPAGAAPVVRARAEALPFGDGAFGTALAVLTIHHWSDWRAGLREMARVSRRRVVLFTWDPESDGSWLGEYFSHVIEDDRRRFPSMGAIAEVLGEIEVVPVLIPHDCTDGFMGAYWRRPAADLDPPGRRAISSQATRVADGCLAKLAEDLGSGAWMHEHGSLLEREEIDLGYRLIVALLPPKPVTACGSRTRSG
jgi:SAM-dependent methyltransferase